MNHNNNNIMVDRFADIRVLRFKVPGFESLDLKKKMLIYHLSEAALWGRDILFHQHYRHNMLVRNVLETIYNHQKNMGEIDENLLIYLKRVWFSSGIHHHYSTDKIMPSFTADELKSWIVSVDDAAWQNATGKGAEELVTLISDVLFSSKDAKRVSLDEGGDLVVSSAGNFYHDVTQSEAESYYAALRANGSKLSHGLNSTLTKVDGVVTEQVWRSGGLYGEAIDKVILSLKEASQYADNERQKLVVELLVKYYQTGELALFDQYNIEWLKEHESDVDFINGFIEVYADPLGIKGTWESLVQVVDEEGTKSVKLLSDNAQWFEERSPVDDEFKKKKVSGISMKIINAVMLGGDCYPASPLGINLPNADWLRETYGSKSISLSNIARAHQEASLTSGVIEEFAFSPQEVQWHKEYGAAADELHTHLHECLGHGSGAMREGVKLDDLKAYSSVIEEARADLYALYFMADDKIEELGLSAGELTYKTHYNSYLRNGLLVQLARIEPGRNIEQAHMRNRYMIGNWMLERCADNGWVKIVNRDGKYYVSVSNHEALRGLFGELLAEIQRIKSTGDYEAARNLIEKYGVRVNQEIHADVRQRYQALGMAPYSGFVNPRLVPQFKNGKIVDINIDYSESYVNQMMRYSTDYKTL